jgi:phosphoribosylformimino-5-aminoimidazole carboxamide ribotide isomerase
MESIEQLLKASVDRVILTTSAVEDPNLVKEACRRFGESIIVSIDVREGLVSIRGWQQETRQGAIEFAQSMVQYGVRRFIHTDISRGSTLTEPNFTAIAELITTVKRPVIAAGGISLLIHLTMLKQLGAEGAIIGKALYTGDINLKKALAAID